MCENRLLSNCFDSAAQCAIISVIDAVVLADGEDKKTDWNKKTAGHCGCYLMVPFNRRLSHLHITRFQALADFPVRLKCSDLTMINTIL